MQFVNELKLRRLNTLKHVDVIQLLQFYVNGQVLGGSAAEKFFEFCDRYLGKHSATLNGTELSYAVKFYSLAGGMLSSKLLLKL